MAAAAKPLAATALPRLVIRLDRLRHNAARVVERGKAAGVEIIGVGKATLGDPRVIAALLAGGVHGIGDSRLPTLARLRGLTKAPLMLLRPPQRAETPQAAQVADVILLSELATAQRLSEVVRTGMGTSSPPAGRRPSSLQVILMVDLGDLREGLWPDQALDAAQQIAALPGLQLVGVGTNLTCYGGVIPTPANLGELVALRDALSARLHRPLPVVSGGNSSSLGLLWEGRLPAGVNQLRIGEGILLGRETTWRRPLPGLYQDAFTLQAEILELQYKPSLPRGELAQDAFGQTPRFADRGWRWRAILALGRQDVPPTSLQPLEDGVEILGASSDHLIADVTAMDPRPAVGDVLSFSLDYGGLLAAMTSPFVHRLYQDTPLQGVSQGKAASDGLFAEDGPERSAPKERRIRHAQDPSGFGRQCHSAKGPAGHRPGAAGQRGSHRPLSGGPA